MITKDKNLNFLREKIGEIKIAMFKAEIDSVLQLPNNIISTIKTDDDGNIWFFTSCTNDDYAKNINEHFYAYLEYYQKGSECRLRIGGKASIVKSDNELIDPSLKEKVVLVKLNIMQAEYFEKKFTTPLNGKIMNILSQLFWPDNDYSKTYRFS